MGILHSKHSRELSELQKHTHFDKPEFRRWYKGFIAECPERRMDRDHFSTLYTQLFPRRDPRLLAGYVFDVFDKDGNGYIDFGEFICALSTTIKGGLEEKLRWMFQLYDVNKDGAISYREMLSIVKATHKMTSNVSHSHENELAPEKRVDLVFGIMNKDKDSTITLSEFLKYGKNSTVISALSLSDSLV